MTAASAFKINLMDEKNKKARVIFTAFEIKVRDVLRKCEFNIFNFKMHSFKLESKMLKSLKVTNRKPHAGDLSDLLVSL